MAYEQLTLSCSVTNGSNVVTTTGQTLLADLAVGNLFRKDTPVTSPPYTVLSVVDNNTFQLSVPYVGTTETATFVLHRSFTPNLHLPRFRMGDAGVPDFMTEKMIDLLDAVVGLIPSGSFVVGGSVVFTGPTGAFAQDNANFFWDDTNNRLGLGTAIPLATLDVRGNGMFGAGTGTAGKLDIRDGRLVLTDSDVNHGMTDLAEAAVFARFAALDGSTGGLALWGLSSGDATGIKIAGIIGSTDPTDSTAAVVLQGSKRNTVSDQALGAAETVFKLQNYTTTLLTITGDGTLQLLSGGPKIKNSSGTVQVRNAADNAYAPLITSVLSLSIAGSKVLNSSTGALTFVTDDASYTVTIADGVTGKIDSISESSVGSKYGLGFFTGTIGSAGFGERMRINGDGYVGFGATVPLSKIHVFNGAEGSVARFYGANADGVRLTIYAHDANGIGAIYTYDDNDGGSGAYVSTYLGSADPATALCVNGATGNVTIGAGTGTAGLLDLRGGNLVFSKTGMAHGMTDLAETEVHALFSPASSFGGLIIRGMTNADNYPLILSGVFGVTDPTDTTPSIILRGAKKNSAGQQALAAAETVLKIQNYTTDLITISGNGHVGIGANFTTGDNLYVVGSINVSTSISSRTDAETYSEFKLSAAGSGSKTWIGSNRLRYYPATDQFARSLATEKGTMAVFYDDGNIKFYNQNSITQTGSYALEPTLSLIGTGTSGGGGNVVIGAGSGTAGKLDVRGGNLVLSDSDVAHGMTDITETSVYGYFGISNATAGGLELIGFSDTDATGLSLRGIIGATDPSDTIPAILLKGAKKGTTASQALAAAETVFKLQNYATDLITVLGSGHTSITSASPVALTITGAGSDYYNAAVVLKATADTGARGAGIFMHETGGQNEWFVGRPYGSNDRVVFARVGSLADHDASMCTYSNALASIYQTGASVGTFRLANISTTVAAGDDLGIVEFYSSDSSTNNNGVFAAIRAEANGTFDGGATKGADLVFCTRTVGDGALQDHMKLLANGNLQLENGSVAHGMTDYAASTAFGLIKPYSATGGGLDIFGLSDGDTEPLRIAGIFGTTDPTDSKAALLLNGSKKNGTTNQALGALETVLLVENYTTALVRVLGSGATTFGSTVYVMNNCSAESFTDRTPHPGNSYDALTEIMKIKGRDNKIDHSTLPEFARKTIKNGEIEEEGRDLGAMISIHDIAFQQAYVEITELKKRIAQLEKSLN